MKIVGFAGLLILVALLGPGCNRPSADDRDNRRLVDQILTAITLKRRRLLDEAAQRTTERHDQGLLADPHYQGLKALIDKAREGDWQAAESDGYAFRKKHPFVRPGER